MTRGENMNEDSEYLQAAIFEIIDNQIRDNDPPETKETLERLLSDGHAREEAIKLIGCALTAEVFDIMKHQKPFDQSRYADNLRKLPEMPWEDE
jgi:peroxiredoxin family protein